MLKTARKSVHETSETEFQDDSNLSQESGSEEDIVLQFEPIYKPNISCSTSLYASQ